MAITMQQRAESALQDDIFDREIDGYDGEGTVLVKTEPVTLDDLDEIDAAQQSAESRERIMAQFDATIAAIKQWVEGPSC